MKIALVIGNRPHFIKAAPLLKAMRSYPEIQPVIIHTGQHYDHCMSGAFLEGFSFPPIDVNLGVGSGSSGVQTGAMLSRLDPVFREIEPVCVVSMGDTNTTLAASLAAYQLHIPNAHIEAGMRENIWRPEEINKKMADHCADFLFAPIPRAVENLKSEGISISKIFLTGDITLDTFMANRESAKNHFRNLQESLPLIPECFDLLTLHRAETVDDPVILCRILEALAGWPNSIVFPLHPRTEKQLIRFGLDAKLKQLEHIRLLPALPYLDFLSLLLHSTHVATDSSGVLKEAFYANKPCIVLDDSTEYREIFDLHAAYLGGRDSSSIHAALALVNSDPFPQLETNPFGDGTAAEQMVGIMIAALSHQTLNEKLIL